LKGSAGRLKRRFAFVVHRVSLNKNEYFLAKKY